MTLEEYKNIIKNYTDNMLNFEKTETKEAIDFYNKEIELDDDFNVEKYKKRLKLFEQKLEIIDNEIEKISLKQSKRRRR